METNVEALGLAFTNLPREYSSLEALTPWQSYMANCRHFDQFCRTARALANADLYCPFCPTELTRRGRVPLRQRSGWMVLPNEYPRLDVETMMLVVPKRHILSVADLTDEDWMDRGYLEAVCERELGFAGGGIVMRAGDPRDNAGTLPHVHVNMIQPKREGGMSVPLAKTIGGKFGHRKDYARLRMHVRMVDEKGGTDWLFSEAGIEETAPSAPRK